MAPSRAEIKAEAIARREKSRAEITPDRLLYWYQGLSPDVRILGIDSRGGTIAVLFAMPKGREWTCKGFANDLKFWTEIRSSLCVEKGL